MKTLFLFICLKVNFFFFFAVVHSLQDHSSPTRDRTPHPIKWKHRVQTTEPAGKSLHSLLEDVFPLLLSGDLFCLEPPKYLCDFGIL